MKAASRFECQDTKRQEEIIYFNLLIISMCFVNKVNKDTAIQSIWLYFMYFCDYNVMFNFFQDIIYNILFFLYTISVYIVHRYIIWWNSAHITL